MQCYENDLTYEEYVGLRESVGWSNYEKDFVENAIHNSTYCIKIVENKQTIAMGRLIGDGQLISEKGKEEFYIKKGFKRIPHEFCGSGMRKVIRKQRNVKCKNITQSQYLINKKIKC